MNKTFCALVTFSLATFAHAASENTVTAPVSGFVYAFLYDKPISNGMITVLETGQQIQTDENGKFGPFDYPVGKPITMEFKKFGYKTTQTATIVVPPKGLTEPYNNVSLQVPTTLIFYSLKAFIGAKIDEQSCHVATTVTAHHKTLYDLPQGEANAKVTLNPSVPEQPFYFGIFKSGPLKNKTSPFSKDLKETSDDGGVAFFNLPVREEYYTLSAEKSGVEFNKVQFWCRKDAFINLSPPQGPMAKK